MFHGNIFVSHCFCLILCMDKYLIQILSYINLSAGYFYTGS